MDRKPFKSQPLEISPMAYLVMAVLLGIGWVASREMEPPEIKPRPTIDRRTHQIVKLERLGIQVRLDGDWAMLDVTNWSRKRAHFVNETDNCILFLEEVSGSQQEVNKPGILPVSWDPDAEKFAGWLRRSAILSKTKSGPIRITAISSTDPSKSKTIDGFLASIEEL